MNASLVALIGALVVAFLAAAGWLPVNDFLQVVGLLGLIVGLLYAGGWYSEWLHKDD